MARGIAMAGAPPCGGPPGQGGGGGGGGPPPPRETAEGLPWNAGGVIGREGRDLEAASREEPAHFAARECELVELTAGGADPPAPAGQARIASGPPGSCSTTPSER